MLVQVRISHDTSKFELREPLPESACLRLACTKSFSYYILQLFGLLLFQGKAGDFIYCCQHTTTKKSKCLSSPQPLECLASLDESLFTAEAPSLMHLHSNQRSSPTLTLPQFWSYQNWLTFNVRFKLLPPQLNLNKTTLFSARTWKVLGF